MMAALPPRLGDMVNEGARRTTLLVASAAALVGLVACGSAAPAGPKLVTYSGDGVSVTVKNVQTALKETSPEFRAFIADRLHSLWVSGGSIPGCQSAALISLTAYRADGFASASNEGMFGNGTCARGGNNALYARVGGTWREIAGTQSGYACSVLKKYRVPVAIAGSTCTSPAGNPQPYRG